MSRKSCRMRLIMRLLVAMSLAVAGCGKGKSPAKAPAENPPAITRESKSGQAGEFRERAVEAGIDFRMGFLPNEQGETFKINLYDHGCGVSVADVDGDGHDDVYFLNQLGANALYRNRGDGTFENITEQAGVAIDDRICVAATFADIDNDGDQDLYVTSTRGGNVLFENHGTGTFREITESAGLTQVAHSATASFVDLDNDSFLDLIVTNTARWTLQEFDETQRYYPGAAEFLEFARSPKEKNVCYRNNGDRTFTDVTEEWGLEGQGWGGDIGVFDFNDDGRSDLLVTNMFGASQLYENRADGSFRDVTTEVLGKVSWGAIGCKPLDYNNDGRLDLFISDMHSDMWAPVSMPRLLNYAMRYDSQKHPYVTGAGHLLDEQYALELEEQMADDLQIQYDEVVFGNTLFQNQGDRRFAEVSDAAGLETWWPWGIATGDFDGDGWLDVFLPSGMGYPYPYWPNQLRRNNGDGTFVECAEEYGIEPPPGGEIQAERIAGHEAAKSSRCAAVADFNGDGRLDLIVNNFNDRPYYFVNEIDQQHFLAVKLQGRRGNRDAVGAVLRLHIGDQIMTRQIHPAGGYLSQSSKMAHFGLGSRTSIDRLEIRWPGGQVQTVESPRVDTQHLIVEPGA